MTRQEKAQALRDDKSFHYNCFHAVLTPFCEEYGLDAGTVKQMGIFLGGGVRHGSVCGAVLGAMAVLGLAGVEDEKGMELLNRFQEKRNSLACKELLDAAYARGEERKPHCDALICDTVALVEELLGE